jgi:hypothetical protein
MKSAYKIIDRKPEGRKSFGRPTHRWEGKIKMDLEIFGSA